MYATPAPGLPLRRPERLNDSITLRLTSNQRRELEQRAEAAGADLSVFARAVLLAATGQQERARVR